MTEARTSRTWLIAAGVALASVLVYLGTLDAGYPLDDEIQVQNNLYIRSLGSAFGIFGRGTWPGYVYRPLPTFTYALTHALVGANPWLYHLTSVVLHALAAVLVLFCLRRVLDEKVAAIGALLFAVHPAHVEAIASIANRTELLVAVLGLGALLLLLPSPDGRRWRAAEVAGRVALEALLFLGALLAKESAVTFFLLLPLLAFTRRDVTGDGQPLFRRMVRDCWPGMLALVVATASYFVARGMVLSRPVVDPVIAPIDNWLVTLPAIERMVRAFVLLGRYVAILIAPHGLSADYSSATAGMARDLTTPQSIAFLLLAIGLAASVVVAWWRGSRTWLFIGGWFFASFAITANVVLPIGVVFADRLAYLPSVALCALLAVVLARIASAPLRRTAVAGVALLFASLTVSYAEVWHDNRTLFLYELRTSPESAWVQAGMGNELLRAGARDAARARFLEALRIYPQHVHAAHGIAMIELAEGDEVEGRAWLERALELEPGFAPSLVVLGSLELDAGRTDDAGRLFARALSSDSASVGAKVGLLAATLRTGNLARAAAMRDALVALDPERADVRALSDELDRRRAAAQPGASSAVPG